MKQHIVVKSLNLPKGWAETTVDTICDVRSGIGFPKIHQGEIQGEYPFYKVGDISKTVKKGESWMTQADNYVSKDVCKILNGKPFSKGTTVFAKIGEALKLNRRAMVSFDSLFDNNVMGLTPVQTLIETEYLFYFFHTICLENISRSTTVPSIRKEDVESILIPLPPLNEQKRIVVKIKTLFTKVESIKKSLDDTKLQLERARQSLLKSAFEGKLTEKWRQDNLDKLESVKNILELIDSEYGHSTYSALKNNYSKFFPSSWGFIPIGRVEKFMGSGITPKGGKSVYLDKGIPFLRSQNVYPDKLHLEKVVYVSKELHDMMSRTHIQDEDILLNITGASIGRSNIIPNNFGDGNVNQHVCIIRCHSKINPKFLSHWLNSPSCQKSIFSNQQGQTREGLNYSQIREMGFPLCSFLEQNKIVSQIEQGLFLIDETMHSTNSMILQLTTLRSSILKQAFEGKLVAQNPDDESMMIMLEKFGNTKLSKS